ncbi:polysaccharide deacetylase family protein [Streptomyces canus]|uniref:polysaccharide deacetylase family protein n=1 Tax=Streptomyces canus TaxID=58343 RepID=UPI0034044955
MTRRIRLPRPTAALAAGLAVTVLASCSTLTGVVSPAEARQGAGADNSVAGPVDCRKAHCVALTFDGGPSKPTPKLLDLLKRDNVKATFFVQGKGHSDTYPATITRMAKEGHEIGNHTWSHKNLTELTPRQISAEMEPVQKEIQNATGKAPTLMRPPQGRTDDDVSEVLKKLGLAQILWSVTAKDYQTTDTRLIKKRVLDQTKRDGIVLLHERYAGTIPAVAEIIPALRKLGYTFVTVSELIFPATPRPGTVYRP